MSDSELGEPLPAAQDRSSSLALPVALLAICALVIAIVTVRSRSACRPCAWLPASATAPEAGATLDEAQFRCVLPEGWEDEAQGRPEGRYVLFRRIPVLESPPQRSWIAITDLRRTTIRFDRRATSTGCAIGGVVVQGELFRGHFTRGPRNDMLPGIASGPEPLADGFGSEDVPTSYVSVLVRDPSGAAAEGLVLYAQTPVANERHMLDGLRSILESMEFVEPEE